MLGRILSFAYRVCTFLLGLSIQTEPFFSGFLFSFVLSREINFQSTRLDSRCSSLIITSTPSDLYSTGPTEFGEGNSVN